MPRKKPNAEPQGILHISRWTANIKIDSGDTRWTFYGVGASGAEEIYAECTTREEFDRFKASDALWREASAAIFRRLLDDPRTRDTVLRINIKAALDKGDNETAIELIKALSPEALAEVLKRSPKPEAGEQPVD